MIIPFAVWCAASALTYVLFRRYTRRTNSELGISPNWSKGERLGGLVIAGLIWPCALGPLVLANLNWLQDSWQRYSGQEAKW